MTENYLVVRRRQEQRQKREKKSAGPHRIKNNLAGPGYSAKKAKLWNTKSKIKIL
jgi:hypothetical protein